MQELYTPDDYLIDEMFLGQIVFEKDINITDVTLFAYYYNPFSDALGKVEYYCNFEILVTILALADEKTDTVTRIISERIMDDFYREYPCVIDIEGLFSYPLKIDGIPPLLVF